MNWGYKIMLVIVVFMVGMLGLVYFAFQQNVDMIDDNYYEKELLYQNVIDGKNNFDALQASSILTQDPTNLILHLPTALAKGVQNGTLQLIRNDDPKKDKTYTLKTDTMGIMYLPKDALRTGWYTARMHCLHDSKEYYREEKINIESK